MTTTVAEDLVNWVNTYDIYVKSTKIKYEEIDSEKREKDFKNIVEKARLEVGIPLVENN